MLRNGSRLWQVVGMATGVRCSCTCLWLVSEFVTSAAVNDHILKRVFFLSCGERGRGLTRRSVFHFPTFAFYHAPLRSLPYLHLKHKMFFTRAATASCQTAAERAADLRVDVSRTASGQEGVNVRS